MANGRLRRNSDGVRFASQTGIHFGIRCPPIFAPSDGLSVTWRMEARVGIDDPAPFFEVVFCIFMRKPHDLVSIGILRFEAVWYRFW
jgi:hypothetical protein